MAALQLHHALLNSLPPSSPPAAAAVSLPPLLPSSPAPRFSSPYQQQQQQQRPPHLRHLSSRSYSSQTLHSATERYSYPPFTDGGPSSHGHASSSSATHLDLLPQHAARRASSPRRARPMSTDVSTLDRASRARSRSRSPGPAGADARRLTQLARTKAGLELVIGVWACYTTVRYFLGFTLYMSRDRQIIGLALGAASATALALLLAALALSLLIPDAASPRAADLPPPSPRRRRDVVLPRVRAALPYLASLLLIAPAALAVALVVPWRHHPDPTARLDGRCQWDIDVVWSGTGSRCPPSAAPPWWAWLLAAILRLVVTAATLVLYHAVCHVHATTATRTALAHARKLSDVPDAWGGLGGSDTPHHLRAGRGGGSGGATHQRTSSHGHKRKARLTPMSSVSSTMLTRGNRGSASLGPPGLPLLDDFTPPLTPATSDMQCNPGAGPYYPALARSPHRSSSSGAALEAVPELPRGAAAPSPPGSTGGYSPRTSAEYGARRLSGASGAEYEPYGRDQLSFERGYMDALAAPAPGLGPGQAPAPTAANADDAADPDADPVADVQARRLARLRADMELIQFAAQFRSLVQQMQVETAQGRLSVDSGGAERLSALGSEGATPGTDDGDGDGDGYTPHSDDGDDAGREDYGFPGVPAAELQHALAAAQPPAPTDRLRMILGRYIRRMPTIESLASREAAAAAVSVRGTARSVAGMSAYGGGGAPSHRSAGSISRPPTRATMLSVSVSVSESGASAPPSRSNSLTLGRAVAAAGAESSGRASPAAGAARTAHARSIGAPTPPPLEGGSSPATTYFSLLNSPASRSASLLREVAAANAAALDRLPSPSPPLESPLSAHRLAPSPEPMFRGPDA